MKPGPMTSSRWRPVLSHWMRPVLSHWMRPVLEQDPGTIQGAETGKSPQKVSLIWENFKTRQSFQRKECLLEESREWKKNRWLRVNITVSRFVNRQQVPSQEVGVWTRPKSSSSEWWEAGRSSTWRQLRQEDDQKCVPERGNLLYRGVQNAPCS